MAVMKAQEIKVGDKIEGWSVLEVKHVSYAEGVLGMPSILTLLKLELRHEHSSGFTYVTHGEPRINWYDGADDVEVER
jgi:hypothetical protein